LVLAIAEKTEASMKSVPTELTSLDCRVAGALSTSMAKTLPAFEMIKNGLANEVWRIHRPDHRYYVKRAKPHESVTDREEVLGELFPPDRQQIEVAALSRFRAIWGNNVVPDVLVADPDAGLVALEDAGVGVAPLDSVQAFDDRVQAVNSVLDLLFVVSPTDPNNVAPVRGSEAREQEARAARIASNVAGPLKVLASGNGALTSSIDRLAREHADVATCLTHGDLHGGNILLSPQRKICLIDFEEAMVHDRAYDLGILVGSSLVGAVARGFPPQRIEELLASIRSHPHTTSLTKQRGSRSAVNFYACGHIADRVVGSGKWNWRASERIALRHLALAFCQPERWLV
jgi:aminoglycoside phosphotransferase (APT) family kinase protein